MDPFPQDPDTGSVAALTTACGSVRDLGGESPDVFGGPSPPQPVSPPGQGPSKKAAKHKAAEVALKLLKGGDMLEPTAPEEPR